MNKVVHFEIPADDEKRAHEFYQNVFGWKVNAIPNMGYAMVQTGPTSEDGDSLESGFINGGMLKRQAPVTTPVITIDTDDMDTTIEELKAHGGEVIRGKMPVGDMGYAAYFKDTEGNVIGLWQSNRK